jgi:hypothetical protein
MEARRVTMTLSLAGFAWLTLVTLAAHSGTLRQVPAPLIGPLVALGIVLPTLAYAALPVLRAYFATVGLFPLTVLHLWRIPAALLFFWYGAQGLLPPVFWILAGVGDLVAGCLALPLLKSPTDRSGYLRIHAFGFADFVVAVGTGLTYTLLDDPRMLAIRELPLALIPLFGVGISGASHLIAFDLLRRRTSVAA